MKTAIRQHDITDCAAACIRSIAAHYGQDIPITVIREASGTNLLGTSIKGVTDACKELGFHSVAYKSPDRDVSALKKVDLPVILHTVNRKGDLHFVVLYKAGKRSAKVMDPAKGRLIRMNYALLAKEWSGALITMAPDPGKTFHFGIRQPSFFSLCVRMLATSRRDILRSLPGSLLAVLAGICVSLFLQHTVDVVLPSGDIARLGEVCLMMGAMMVCALIALWGSNKLIIRAGIRMDAQLILGYLRHLFRLSPGFFAHHGAGELNSRIGDAMKVRRFLTDGIVGISASAMLLVGSFALMFTYYWKLALLALAFVPAYLTLFLIINRINRKMNRQLVECAADFERKCVESIASVRSLKYFGRSEAAGPLMKAYAQLSWNSSANAGKQNAFGISADAITKLLSFSIISAGSLFIFRGVLTTGELVSFFSLTSLFATPLGQLVNISEYYNEASLSMERLRDITSLEPETESGLEPDLDEAQDIEFRDVRFSYPGCGSLLEHLSLTLPKGRICAITGESGCGKSSLAALLMQDYRPKEGRILCGGTDIGLISPGLWRKYISIVPQEPGIMGCSILENVSGGEKDPDLKKIGGILDELGLKDFIASLPLGILTPAGEKGCLLSGGQRQRIALARALYRDPKILILDEATSSLDEESQRYILDKARSLRDEGKSVILISHKKDNIAIADQVIRLAGGRQDKECAL